MSTQDNVALAQKIYQLFNDDRYDRVLELADKDIELVLYPFNQTFHGPEGFVNFMKGFKVAFPDLIIEVKNQIAEGDQLVNEITGKATHTGPLMTPAGEVPPTGRPVTFTVCEVWGIKDGKLASLRNYQDSGNLMRQLGLME
jgi:steroid delta-isomerase-like uncharacterized protein